MTEEHKQHLRESALRRIAAMSEEEHRAKFVRSLSPETRKKISESMRKRYAEMSPEERAAFSAHQNRRWLNPTPEVEEERKIRAEKSREHHAAMPEEKRRELYAKLHESVLVPVTATPIANPHERVPYLRSRLPLVHDPIPLSYPSVKSAAEWLVAHRIAKTVSSAVHMISETICGRKKTAYGHIWRRAGDAPQSPVPNS